MKIENDNPKFKSAFIAFIGRPNSGKSTLLNAIIGEELSIVTTLPQTTQRNMRGIYNGEGFQLVFVDTPGMHRGKHTLNKSMYEQAVNILTDSGIDIICYLVDLSRSFGEEEDEITDQMSKVKATTCIIFNKTDLCETVEQVKKDFFYRYPELENFPAIEICALAEQVKNIFLNFINPFISEGPKYYPDDDLTDSNLRFFAAEYIRKQIIELTHEEVPHASCVEILDYKEKNNRHAIEAVIHVETTGQKGIVIGKKGSVINKIRKQAQKELSDLVGMTVRMTCHVKVTPKWRDNKSFLTGLGLIQK
jgi:GTP-binding protein Era